MTNWIYDERTDHARLMVGYDRYGLTVREWNEADEEEGFYVQENFFTWPQYRGRTRNYSGDDGRGRMKQRLVAAAISLLGQQGGSSDSSGLVPSMDQCLNCGHVFTC